MKRINSGKCKNMMYVQQMSHLPAGNIDTLVDLIEKNLKPNKYAVILHDKDIDDNGTPKEPHVHVMMSFDNARSLRSISQKLGEVDAGGCVHTEHIEVWKGNSNNGYAYLVHETDRARTQHIYDAGEVRANFDYPAFVQNVSQTVSKISECRNAAMVKTMLDMLYQGIMTKEQVEKQLPGSMLGRYQPQIDRVFAKYLQNRAAEWRKEMVEKNKSVRVIWIYGAAGTGKTSFAKQYARKEGQNYYISGSSRDVFQNYTGQHTMILDELRPESIPYQDLLRITDPYGIDSEVMAPSRYSDKALACDLIIITSPFSPYEFYTKMFGTIGSQTDSFEQLRRRISLTLTMTESEIFPAGFDKTRLAYVPDYTRKRPNPHLAIIGQSVKVDADKIYDSMFD